MKIINQNTKEGIIEIIPETLDDLWHLSHIIEVGDNASSKTTRRIQDNTGDKLRSDRGVKKTFYLGLDIESISFHLFTGKLRLTGVITRGPEDLIPLGSHHTLEVKLNTPLTIKKDKWQNWAIKRLNQAIDDSKKLSAIIVVLEDDTATLGLMRQFGIEYYGPIKGHVSGKRIIDKNREKNIVQFYEKVIESITKFDAIQNIVIAGPGFVKNDFYDYIKNKHKDLASKSIIESTGSGGRNGINEVLTYTLTDEKHSPYFDVFSTKDEPIKLMSALGKDKEFLRKSILPTLLNTVEYNQARQVKNVNIFEISNIYTENGSYERLAVALSNKLDKTDWLNKKNSDYFTAKGLFESLLKQLGIASSRVSYKPLSDSKFYHPYRSALVSIDKKVVAVIGEVHPLMYKEYKVDKTVVMEIDLIGLLNIKTSDTKYKKLPSYPSMSRDVALLLKEEITSEEVIRLIKKTGREIVVDVTPFDEYKGEHVDKGYKSLALNIVYQDINKTLTDNEVTSVHKKIIETLVLNLNAQIR